MLRREGYALQVGKPQVIFREFDGVRHEPVEELTIDVDSEYVGAVTGEISRRRGVLMSQLEGADCTTRLVFEISTRGLLGLRNNLLALSRGTAVMNSLFVRHQPVGAPIQTVRRGALIASVAGKALTFGLFNAQQRGVVYIHPQTQVYEGMVVGLNSRDEDLEINVCKAKKLTNTRAAGADDALILTPPTVFSLEQCLDFLEDDELLEVTPESLRLRKKLLVKSDRDRAQGEDRLSKDRFGGGAERIREGQAPGASGTKPEGHTLCVLSNKLQAGVIYSPYLLAGEAPQGP